MLTSQFEFENGLRFLFCENFTRRIFDLKNVDLSDGDEMTDECLGICEQCSLGYRGEDANWYCKGEELDKEDEELWEDFEYELQLEELLDKIDERDGLNEGELLDEAVSFLWDYYNEIRAKGIR